MLGFGRNQRLDQATFSRALRQTRGIRASGTPAKKDGYRYINWQNDRISCRCGCGQDRVDKVTIDTVQKVRQITNRPIRVNSCVRCRRHNSTVSSATQSQHISDGNKICTAIDIAFNNQVQLYQYIVLFVMLGAKGIGINWRHRFIHIDFRSGQPLFFNY